MKYFFSKLSAFPPCTFVSINQGFSPDCDPASHGGDGRPYAKEAAKTRPVLTWDYSVTEGEGTVLPHCRIRRVFQQRRAESALGCYSGGICYTMAPKLNCLSIFGCAEAYWNPALEPDAFGDGLSEIGPLLEEFEVVPDWGYRPPFPYSPQRLQRSMARLIPLLRQVNPDAKPRLPLAPTLAEFRGSQLFFADLFQKLASAAADFEEAQNVAQAAGKIAANRKTPLALDELDAIIAGPGDFPQKNALRTLCARLRQYDVESLKKSYVDTVYGIYDSGIPTPADPRNGEATNALFKHFHCDLVKPSRGKDQPPQSPGK
jgi:hypothetical protein